MKGIQTIAISFVILLAILSVIAGLKRIYSSKDSEYARVRRFYTVIHGHQVYCDIRIIYPGTMDTTNLMQNVMNCPELK